MINFDIRDEEKNYICFPHPGIKHSPAAFKTNGQLVDYKPGN